MFNHELLTNTLKQAFTFGRNNIQPVLGAALLVMLFLFTMALIGYELLVSYWGLDGNSEEAMNQAMMPLQLIILILAAPFEAGLAYVAWRKVSGLQTSVRQVFGPWALATPLIAIALISSVLANLGLSALVIPGLYIMAVLSFANLFYLFRRGSPIKAMLESAKVVHQHLFTVMLYNLIMATIMGVSAIPFGLGLIVTVPMFFYGKAILFNELFPEFAPKPEGEQQSEPSSSSSSGHFEA